MSNLVPTISSGLAGPLGVKHLPRLWQKASLDAAGKLHADYPALGAGYDQMTLTALDIANDDFLAFIADKMPSYFELETWVKERSSLDAGKIAAHNRVVEHYIHDDATRGEILSEIGVEDDGSITDAVNLNNFDDWNLFHKSQIVG